MTIKIAATVLTAALLAGAGQAVAFAQGGSAAAAASTSPTCSAAGTAGLAGPAGTRLDVLGPLAQIQPTRHQNGASGARICQARNGFESFQLEVSAPAGTAVNGIQVSASSLSGPGGAGIPAADVRLYREDYTTIHTATDGELADVLPRSADGTCQGDCRFPDALIPDVDAAFHEKRKAFPINVPAGENRVVWADVQVPTGQQPGAYTGSVTVSVGGTSVKVPVALQVLPVTLPSTSSLGGAYFVSLGGGRVADAAAYKVMAELGLDNRITVVPNSPQPTSALDSTFRALLQGTDPKVLLPGAALTDLAVHTTWPAGYASAYASFLRGINQFDKGFAYCDEVSETTCAQNYTASGAKAAGIALTPIDNGGSGWPKPSAANAGATVPANLSGSTRGLINVVNYLPDDLPGLAAWRAQAAGRRVWGYTSCMSGGCWDGDPADGAKYDATAYWNGWDSYGIDQVASEQRAFGWQAFATGVDGELYYDVTSDTGVWNDPFNFGLNGDGTLFYPYDAARVGGADPIPLESIRIKRIRDGRQDYELLKLASAQSSTARTSAQGIATNLFTSWHTSAVSSATFDAARQRLVDLFPGSTPTRTVVAAHDLDCNGHPDVLAVAAGTGDLLFYGRGAADWLPGVPAHVGTGFLTGAKPTYTSMVLPGDVDGDGAPDLVTADAHGTVQLRRGNCTGSFGAPSTLGVTATHLVPVGDFSGDGRVDLLDQQADGTLLMLAGNGAGGFAAPVRVGGGWTGLQIVAAGDVDGDGLVDLVARRTDGTVVLYPGDGHGGWKLPTWYTTTGLVVPATSYPTLFGPGDVDGDGRADLVTVDNAGEMANRPGNGTGGFGAPQRIGGGWMPGNVAQIAQ